MNREGVSVLNLFCEPPAAWGPVPFYWWAGEPLERERLAWQLDHLCAKGVRQTIISYPHRADGPTDSGDPQLFSPAWWDLFRWFLEQCRARGMTVGFQDYTLCKPLLQAIGQGRPDMEGGQLSCVWEKVGNEQQTLTAQRSTFNAQAVEEPRTKNSEPRTPKMSVRLSAEPGTKVVGAWAYPLSGERSTFNAQRSTLNGDNDEADRLEFGVEGALDLSGQVRGGVLTGELPEGEWLVALVFARLNAFDPLHPDSGRLAIERLYEPFVRECPGEVGRTLTLFFQDELDFGSRMPFWSNRLFDAFQADKGYDLRPLLPTLWLDLGSVTEKVRLDFSDAVVRRLEAYYFKPVYHWHEEHGTLFGNDNLGRGEIAVGRQYYGDTFRTMRWYSAPGTDDPKLHEPRAFKGIKVNSSIAHLYRRPRVWIEAFHSSGWGTTPGEVVAALNEDFAYGATVVNLHGLYYTTRGGWWEWAAPDFHFRQPYWGHIQAFNAYCTRLAWLLSQGVHCCDVAILYPISALDAQPETPEMHRLVAHVGNGVTQSAETDDPQPEESAFGVGKYLFGRACDFDFIDDESVVRAQAADGELRVSGEDYRVLILPSMDAIRFATLAKARAFVQAGGVVIAYGRLPSASDRAGRGDALIEALLLEVFGVADGTHSHEKTHPSGGCGVFIRKGYDEVLRAINGSIVRDAVSTVEPLQVLHRRFDGSDSYYMFNPSPQSVETLLRVRATGKAETWDAWTGKSEELPVDAVENGVSTVRVTLAAKESRVVVFGGRRSEVGGQRSEGEATDSATTNGDAGGQRAGACSESPRHPGSPRPPGAEGEPQAEAVVRLEGPWKFTVRPTLDNRFGDFRLPASEGFLGPETRRFRYAEETEAGGNWHEAGFDDTSWAETTYSFGPRLESLGPLPPDEAVTGLEARLVAGEPVEGAWQPYAFSLRWGIERDPFLTDWLSGPHGLKGQVPDDYLDFQCETPGSVWYLRAEVFSDKEVAVPFVMGGRCAFGAWLNGLPVLEQVDALPPGLYEPWCIPHYTCEPKVARVTLRPGVNRLLLKLIQPEGQRTRAFAAFSTAEADPRELGLRWFRDSHSLRPSLPAGPQRRAVWLRFLAPPGLQGLRFAARGDTQVWADGRVLVCEEALPQPDGSLRYHATVAHVSPYPVTVALRVEAFPEFRAGDVLPEPVGMLCGSGELPLGDWCAYGLAAYSGQGEYRAEFLGAAAAQGERLVLDLGEVSASAEIRINGHPAATLVAAPWRADITEHVLAGMNTVSICVANTLANHYSVGIPTPYAFPAQTKSGLFGPVCVLRVTGKGPVTA